MSLVPHDSATSFDDLVYHGDIAVSFFELGRSNPNVTICGNILSRLVKDFSSILVRLQTGQSQPQLWTNKNNRKRERPKGQAPRAEGTGVHCAAAEPSAMQAKIVIAAETRHAARLALSPGISTSFAAGKHLHAQHLRKRPAKSGYKII